LTCYGGCGALAREISHPITPVTTFQNSKEL
jgi:hypothetical protein